MKADEQNFFSYDDIRNIALKNGIKDNKVSIGMWAKLNGFSNKRKMTKGKTQIIYFRDSKNSNEIVEYRGAKNFNINLSFS